MKSAAYLRKALFRCLSVETMIIVYIYFYRHYDFNDYFTPPF